MKERAASKAFKMPRPVPIAGRTSTITNSFVNGIIPVAEPSDEEVEDALRVLGMSPDDVRCAYCGDPATEWDHLRPIVSGKRPTGFISEIRGLVPACGKCSQPKGGSDWREWITGPAPLPPASREGAGPRGEDIPNSQARGQAPAGQARFRSHRRRGCPERLPGRPAVSAPFPQASKMFRQTTEGRVGYAVLHAARPF